MTNNFERTLGQGGFGVVYHGNLNGNEEVAVKVLSQSSAQGYKQFKAEVLSLQLTHRFEEHVCMVYQLLNYFWFDRLIFF